MALCDVHELSSILRTEDLEKSELIRKKLSIELAIKHQEGRLQYEVDEREQCIRKIATTNDNLIDAVSSLELKELTLQELNQEIISSKTLNFDELLKDHEENTNSVCSAFESLSLRMERTILVIDAVEENQAKCITKSKTDHKLKLKGFVDTLLASACRTDECIERKRRNDSELDGLDVKTASVCSEIDSLETVLGLIVKDVLSRQDCVENLEREVATHKAENAVEDFKFSAELGKRAERITTEKEAIVEETKIAAALDEEAAKLAQVVQVALRRSQELSDKISGVQHDIDCGRKGVADLHSSKVTRQQAKMGVLSELTAVHQLHQTIALQSFKPRADELAEELSGVSTANARLEVGLKTLHAQLDDNLSHGDLHNLHERAATAEATNETTMARRGVVRAELDAQKQTVPILLAEQSRLESSLADTASRSVARQEHEALQKQVDDLHAAQNGQDAVEDVEHRAAALQQENDLAVSAQSQRATLAQETRELTEKCKEELAVLQQVASERDQTALVRNLSKDKQKRLAAAKEAATSAHRQKVAKLRRALLEEDKLFQQTQQQDRSNHDAAVSALTEDLCALTAQLVHKQSELETLQKELGEVTRTAAPGPSALSAPMSQTAPSMDATSWQSLSQVCHTQSDAHVPAVSTAPASVPTKESEPTAAKGAKGRTSASKKRKL